MLIQRRPSDSTTSTFGSAWAAWLDAPSASARARARAERLIRGLKRLGIGSERVVQRVHRGRFYLRGALSSSRTHSRCIERGGGTWPGEAPATASGRTTTGGTVPIPSRCDRTPPSGLRHTATEAFNLKGAFMAVQALSCKECGSEYELEARYVCERCFGPLEVKYDLGALDAEAVKRRIQAGPQNLWRYADFLPFAQAPRSALPAGCTPLLRATRLAERLGLREVWVKNDAANPTHSFKDRVVSVALAKAQELGFEVVACASTGNLANAVAAHAAAAGLDSYVFIPADLEEQKILATGVYGDQARDGARQLRRRQPALHRAVGRARLGLCERQRAPLLRRGLEDARLRDSARRSASSCPIAWSARWLPGRCSPRSRAASTSGARSGWCRARHRS